MGSTPERAEATRAARPSRRAVTALAAAAADLVLPRNSPVAARVRLGSALCFIIRSIPFRTSYTVLYVGVNALGVPHWLVRGGVSRTSRLHSPADGLRTFFLEVYRSVRRTR